MTKKRTTKKRSSSKKKSGSSPGLVIIILLIGGILFVGNQVGLINVDVKAFLDEAFEILGEDNPLSDEGASAPSQTPIVVQPVTSEWYQLYFTSPQYPDKEATRVHIIEDGLIKVINGAQSRVDIAIFELDLEDVGNAILAARDRGVDVRLVTDTDNLEVDETLIRLKKEGIAIVDDKRNALMHNKFMVVDQKAVWTGSWNFTPNGTFRNNNHSIYIQSPELAQNYTAEFEEMFVDKAFGPTSPVNTTHPKIILGDTLIETCFAPEDKCTAKIEEVVRQAQKSITFMAFSFTDDRIGKIVRDRAKAGVAVRGLFETRGSETEFSEFGRMKRAKLDVLQDGNPYTLHHKVFVVDGSTVILGSFNFSENASGSNDENLLVIHNAAIAQQFLAEFDRNYAVALNPPNQ